MLIFDQYTYDAIERFLIEQKKQTELMERIAKALEDLNAKQA